MPRIDERAPRTVRPLPARARGPAGGRGRALDHRPAWNLPPDGAPPGSIAECRWSTGRTRRQANAPPLDRRPAVHRRRDFPRDGQPRTPRRGWRGRDRGRTTARRGGPASRPSRDDQRRYRPGPGSHQGPRPGIPGRRDGDRYRRHEASRRPAAYPHPDRRPSPTVAGPPNHDADCGADRSRWPDQRTNATATPIHRPRRLTARPRLPAVRPEKKPATPGQTLGTGRMLEPVWAPRRRHEPARLRGAPTPGRPGRPGTRRTGSTPPGGPGPAVPAPTPRNSGAGGPVDPPAHPVRPQRRRTDRPATRPRWAGLAQSSPR